MGRGEAREVEDVFRRIFRSGKRQGRVGGSGFKQNISVGESKAEKVEPVLYRICQSERGKVGEVKEVLC